MTLAHPSHIKCEAGNIASGVAGHESTKIHNCLNPLKDLSRHRRGTAVPPFSASIAEGRRCEAEVKTFEQVFTCVSQSGLFLMMVAHGGPGHCKFALPQLFDKTQNTETNKSLRS